MLFIAKSNSQPCWKLFSSHDFSCKYNCELPARYHASGPPGLPSSLSPMTRRRCFDTIQHNHVDMILESPKMKAGFVKFYFYVDNMNDILSILQIFLQFIMKNWDVKRKKWGVINQSQHKCICFFVLLEVITSPCRSKSQHSVANLVTSLGTYLGRWSTYINYL